MSLEVEHNKKLIQDLHDRVSRLEAPVEIKVKKVDEEAILPTRAHDDDAGWDLYALDEPIKRDRFNPKLMQDILKGGQAYIYRTGISVEIPKGYYLDVRARSSVSNNTSLILSNGAGVVDAGYRGEILVVFRGVAPQTQSLYEKGDRIAQMILTKIPDCKLVEVNELSETERGSGGHGSSGV